LAYEVLNQTKPNQIALNWAMWRQTKAGVSKWSYVNKTEKRARLKLSDAFFFFFFFFSSSSSFSSSPPLYRPAGS
jgi:hypothetical protein